MRILGIETSCDETAASIVVNGIDVESSIIASTKEIFAESGGVVPEDAARRQVEYILPVLHKALHEAGKTKDDIDAIAVTKGPGLLGSLLTGVVAARTLAALWEKPLIGVHHTFGHLSSVWCANEAEPVFPAITLSASGGHTDLWYRTSHTKGVLLGRTRDDAAGEAFDKGAALLGLPYPGGPSISKAADSGDETRFSFPIALKGEDTFDYSFSGLKTALRTAVQREGDVDEQTRNDLAASYQFALCSQLTARVQAAVAAHPDTAQVHMVGGVSANTRLRTMLADTLAVPLIAPATLRMCTDNAAMIAAGAYFLVQEHGDSAYDAFTTNATLSLESCVS